MNTQTEKELQKRTDGYTIAIVISLTILTAMIVINMAAKGIY